LDFGQRLSRALLAKQVADEEDYDAEVVSEELSVSDGEEYYTLVEFQDEPADEGFIRELYSRNIKEVLDFDDVY